MPEDKDDHVEELDESEVEEEEEDSEIEEEEESEVEEDEEEEEDEDGDEIEVKEVEEETSESQDEPPKATGGFLGTFFKRFVLCTAILTLIKLAYPNFLVRKSLNVFQCMLKCGDFSKRKFLSE